MEGVVVHLPQDDREQGADGSREAGVVVLGVTEADLGVPGEPDEHAEDDDAEPEEFLLHKPQGYNKDKKAEWL